MAWMIFWAILGGLSQWAVSVLGWEISRQKTSARKRRLARIGFVLCALLGTASISIVTYRSGRLERAHFALDLNYKTQLQVGQPLAIQIGFKNVGTGPAINTDSYSRAFIEEDESRRSADDAISKFKVFSESHDIGANNIPKDQAGVFMTASGPVLSREELENIIGNIRVVYIVGIIDFRDDFGSHSQHICKALQRPVSASTAIWGSCGKWDDER